MSYYINIQTGQVYKLAIESETDLILDDAFQSQQLAEKTDEYYQVCQDEAVILNYEKKVKKYQLEKNANAYLESSPAVQLNDFPIISLVSLTKTINVTNEIELAGVQPNSSYLSDNKWIIFKNIPTNTILESKKSLFQAKIRVQDKVALIKNGIELCTTLEEVDNIDVSTNALDVDLIVDGRLLVQIYAPELQIIQNIANGIFITDLEMFNLWLQKEPA